MEVNQGPEKLGPRVNYRGNDSGLVSLGMAGPVSQHCSSPLKSRWAGEVSPLLPPHFPSLCLSLVLLPPQFGAACREVGAVCLDPCQHGRPGNSGGLSWSPRSYPPQNAFFSVTPTGSPESSGPGHGAVACLQTALRRVGHRGFRCQQREQKRSPARNRPCVPPAHEDKRGRHHGIRRLFSPGKDTVRSVSMRAKGCLPSPGTRERKKRSRAGRLRLQ